MGKFAESLRKIFQRRRVDETALTKLVDGGLSPDEEQEARLLVGQNARLAENLKLQQEARTILQKTPRLYPPPELKEHVLNLIKNEPLPKVPWYIGMAQVYDSLKERILIAPRWVAAIIFVGITLISLAVLFIRLKSLLG